METRTSSLDTAVESEQKGKPSINRLENTSFIILLITILLAPLAFLPTAYIPIDMVKTFVITFGILVSTILFLISSFKNKAISIPKHPLFFISCGIILSLIISSVVSLSTWKSIFGQGFEIGTASFLAVLFLGSLLTVYLTHKEKDRVLYVFGAIVTSFILIALFHTIRFIFGADTLALSIFQGTTTTMFGKWNDLAVFAGFIGLLSYIALQFVNFSKIFKVLLTVLCAGSLILLFLVNYSLVSTVVWLALCGFGAYQYYISTQETKDVKGIMKKLPILTSILIVVLGLLFFKGQSIIFPLVQKLHVDQTEVYLPWQLTLDVASDTIKESPLFGAGPNRFSTQYLKFKPQIINSTMFWNTEFNSGFGLIPTFVVTQGIVGIVLWILLVIVFIKTGIIALKRQKNNLSRFFVASTFFSAAFLWIINIVYVSSHSILFFTFITSALFVSLLIDEGNVPLITIDQTNKNYIGKFLPLILIVFIAICVIWLSVYTKKTIALSYFEGGISSLNLSTEKGLTDAESNFKKALSLDKNDTYYQALSEINILRISALAQKVQADSQKKAEPDMAAINKINALVNESVGYTTEAIKVDPTNYYNYIAEARISELASSLQIKNAYENTVKAYTNALNYNPFSPSIYLSLARIEASQNKMAEAQRYIGLALQLKQNYVDAIFLLSQIQVSQGQLKDAITSVQVAVQINQTSPTLFFQLGLLYYNDKNYQGAVEVLSRAIKLDNNYANAQYFLGLSYARLGNTRDAIIQFENLATTNPDNQEIALILANLKSGKSAFNDVKAPIDNKPEKRKNLPVKEKVAIK